MATKEFWIQIENHPWDAAPNNISRMDGRTIEEKPGMAPPITVNLTSPETGATHQEEMYLPVNDGNNGGAAWQVQDALILRRYTENWAAPHDHKVNPWDLNEPDPSDSGTMGTIPGATIECNVGDKVIVHFRNKDFRTKLTTLKIPVLGGGFPPAIEFKEITIPVPLPIGEREHSLHPHGIVFAPQYDGAYPLSPADPGQPVTQAVDDPAKDESALWASVGVTGAFKKGDRVPPGGTFTYEWNTFGWPSTAGVWHYHDHAKCDVENVTLGAIAFLVIHNPEDPDDVIEPDEPGGEHGGSPIETRCFPIGPIPIMPHDLANVTRNLPAARPNRGNPARQADRSEDDESDLAPFVAEIGNLALRPDKALRHFAQLCLPFYVDPPGKAQYLQYYHEMPGVGMCINGRRFMGNTPTLIAGTETKMRFGMATMNKFTFHTFHIHGHRWVIPGPAGNTPEEIQSSPQNTAVSQFEDTKIFGPANSFSLTINQGSFMGSRFTPDPEQAPGVGEWHMHCHVLEHMMPGGMMGSLLVIEGGELAFPGLLPKGEPCPTLEHGGENGGGNGGNTHQVTIENAGNDGFVPKLLNISVGDKVAWKNNDGSTHTASKTGGPGPNFDTGNISPGGTSVEITFNTAGTMTYQCNIHPNMTGTVQVNP